MGREIERKFLVAGDGKVVSRYGPATPPEQIASDVRRHLGSK